jgi:Ferredoxin
MPSLLQYKIAIIAICLISGCNAWVSLPIPSAVTTSSSTTSFNMVLGLKIGKNYTPKWKKKETLVEKQGDVSPVDKGISGTINVVFKSGSSSLKTLANPGDPIRDIATQAGQFIKYGCGKGECGTCLAKCGGKWIKPCVDIIPGYTAQGEDYVIEVQEVKNKAKSSGKFYSFRSFIMGFYNNLIGMIGFVKTRRAAKKNYIERIEFEDLVARKTAEKKAARLAAEKENK